MDGVCDDCYGDIKANHKKLKLSLELIDHVHEKHASLQLSNYQLVLTKAGVIVHSGNLGDPVQHPNKARFRWTIDRPAGLNGFDAATIAATKADGAPFAVNLEAT